MIACTGYAVGGFLVHFVFDAVGYLVVFLLGTRFSKLKGFCLHFHKHRAE